MFKDKVVLVTGAAGANAGGSGRVAAYKFAEAGAKVVLVDLNAEIGKMVEADMLSKGYEAMFVCCDVCQEDQIKNAIEKAVERFGKLDVLVNNAYFSAQEGLLADTPTEVIDQMITINFRGHFLFCKYAIPELIKQESSAIVNLSSISGVTGEIGYAAYGAAKAAVTSLTRSVATQYGRNGLRCNTVIPGLILSDEMIKMLVAQMPEMEKTFADLDKHILLNRHGRGEDVANAIFFLASENASYITAQTLVVDGGITKHNPTWADQMGL